MSIPTLGFPSRTDAVFALRQQGKTTQQIASAIGIPMGAVTALEASRRGRRTPLAQRRGAKAGVDAIVLPPHVVRELAPHAARRKIPVPDLAVLLVETVVQESMIDAVLDDAGAEYGS